MYHTCMYMYHTCIYMYDTCIIHVCTCMIHVCTCMLSLLWHLCYVHYFVFLQWRLHYDNCCSDWKADAVPTVLSGVEELLTHTSDQLVQLNDMAEGIVNAISILSELLHAASSSVGEHTVSLPWICAVRSSPTFQMVVQSIAALTDT